MRIVRLLVLRVVLVDAAGRIETVLVEHLTNVVLGVDEVGDAILQ